MSETRLNPQAEALLDAMLTVPEIAGAMCSPDGQWVAWTWFGIEPTWDVYAAPTDGTQAPLRLTATDQNARGISWTPDSRSVIVGQDENGNERVQLFRVDLSQPGVLHPLTEASPNYYIQGGQMHPNGRWLVYGANVDEQGDEIETGWVYRHDLDTGERLPLACPQGAARTRPYLNRQGSHVLYTRNDLHPSGRQLWLVDIDGENDREIVNVGANRKVSGAWCPDGEHILLHAEADTHFRVGLWSLRDGTLRWLVDDPARNIEEAYYPRSSDHAVLLEVRSTQIHPTLLDVQSGQEQPFPTMQGSVIPLGRAEDGTWVALRYGPQQLLDIVRMSPENSSLSGVWTKTTLTPADFVPGEDFRWQSVDGLEIQGWLYRARGEAIGTIVDVHGGPTWHYENIVDPQQQFYAALGFHVLAPNYRGSTGFSRAYQESIKEDGWGGREQDDIRTGIEALIAAGIAQPGRVGITGTSYGGYSSWCAITHCTPEIVAAAAPICGMTDLVVDYETTRPDLRPYSDEMMGGSPDEVPDRYRDHSPIHFVRDIRGRLLIVQGEQDPNVTPENVTVVRKALDEAGIAYEVLTFPDEGHGILRRPNQRALYLRLAQFFENAFRAASG